MTGIMGLPLVAGHLAVILSPKVRLLILKSCYCFALLCQVCPAQRVACDEPLLLALPCSGAAVSPIFF